MNIQQLRQFIYVAKKRSIKKASEELFISQQALSKSMQNLEDELEARLFSRTERGTRLTEFGNKLLPIVELMIRQYDDHIEIIHSLAKQEKSKITISFEHIFLPCAMPAEITSQLGEISVRSRIAGDIIRCKEQVQSGEADIGVCHRADDLTGFDYISFISERPVMLMNRNHHLAQKSALMISDLKDVPQLLPNANALSISSYIDTCIKEGFYPNFVFESSDLDILIRNVLANKGIQFTATFALTKYSSDLLVLRPLVHDSLWMEVGFLLNAQCKVAPHIRLFIDTIVNYYST